MKILIFISLLFFLLDGCKDSENPVSNIEKEGEWEIISTKNYEVGSIVFIDPVNGWAVGMNGSIIHSSDGGRNWTIQESGTDNTLTSVCFIDEHYGYVTGYNKTLLSTTDGGNTWVVHIIQSDSSAIFSSIHYDRKNILFISNHGDIFYSTNFGKEWNSKYNFEKMGYSFLYFPNTTCGFAMQSAGSKLKKTIDGGRTWNTYQLPARWTSDIFFLNENNGWFADNWLPSSTIHDSSSVYFTENGGETWTHQSTLHGLSLTNIQFVDTKNGWIADITKIYHTSNGGESWERQYQNEDTGFIKDIFFLNESNGWAITNHGYILKYSVK